MLSRIVIRVIISVVFAGIFYTGWMAIAIPVLKTENTGIILKTVIWLAAPVVTALGFTTGVFIFELLPDTGKSNRSWVCHIIWPDAHCFWNVHPWHSRNCHKRNSHNSKSKQKHILRLLRRV
jgi:hypothetical protein